MTTWKHVLSCPISPPGLGLCSSCTQGFAVSIILLLVKLYSSAESGARWDSHASSLPGLHCGEVFIGGTIACLH